MTHRPERPERPGLGGPWWGFPLLLGISCGLLVVDSSNPGWATLLTVVVLVLWIPLGLVWCARVVLLFSGRGLWRDVIAPPVVVLATLAVAASGVALQLRFAASRTAFDDLAASLPPGSRTVDVDGRVGLFPVRTAERVPAGLLVRDGGLASLLDDGGFALLPAGPDDDLRRGDGTTPRWTDLGGGWWAFSSVP